LSEDGDEETEVFAPAHEEMDMAAWRQITYQNEEGADY
jgi:hypothetical protein